MLLQEGHFLAIVTNGEWFSSPLFTILHHPAFNLYTGVCPVVLLLQPAERVTGYTSKTTANEPPQINCQVSHTGSQLQSVKTRSPSSRESSKPAVSATPWPAWQA